MNVNNKNTSSAMNVNNKNTSSAMNVNNKNTSSAMNVNNKNTASPMNISREPLPRKQIHSTRSKPNSETGIIIKVKLPEKTVQQLRRITLLTYRNKSEYMGTIDMTRSNNGDIIFKPPSRQTSGNYATIGGNYSKIDDAYVSYHSHPGIEGYFTLPSIMDMKRYMEYYPRMQVNIILDRHGYYVIDFIETRKGSRPNKKQVLDEFSKTIKKRTFTNIENMSDFYKSNITTWKKIIKDEFSNTAGISIKYYGYNELATITLVNKDLFPLYNIRR